VVKAEKIITGIFCSVHWLVLTGRVGERKGDARKKRPSISLAVPFHFSFSALYCSFLFLCKRILQT